jgi:hypothetical protein
MLDGKLDRAGNSRASCLHLGARHVAQVAAPMREI